MFFNLVVLGSTRGLALLVVAAGLLVKLPSE